MFTLQLLFFFSSGDSTARLWVISSDGVTQEGDAVVLPHTPLQQASSGTSRTSSGAVRTSNRDVTTVHWSVSCPLLNSSLIPGRVIWEWGYLLILVYPQTFIDYASVGGVLHNA